MAHHIDLRPDRPPLPRGADLPLLDSPPNSPGKGLKPLVLLGRDGGERAAIEAAMIETICANPHDRDAYRQWGNRLLVSAHYAAAIRAYRRAIAIDPQVDRASASDLAKLWANLGTAYYRQTEVEDRAGTNNSATPEPSSPIYQALAAYRQAYGLDPSLPGVGLRLAQLLVTVPALDLPPQTVSGHWSEALVIVEPWVKPALMGQTQSQAQNLSAWLVKSIAETELSQFEAARVSAETAIGLGQAIATSTTGDRSAETLREWPAAYLCWGRALFYLRRCPEAVAAYRQGIAIGQAAGTLTGASLARAWVGLAVALFELADWPGVAAACGEALAIDPNHAEARWIQANLWLHQGDYQRGWREFDWRWQAGVVAEKPEFAQPEWQGENLAGQTLLVYAQCGLGDIIQFARFLPLIVAQGARVVTATDRAAVSLLAAIPGVQAIDRQSVLPAFDRHISFLSLPRFFVTTPETVFAPVRYLTLPTPRSTFQAKLDDQFLPNQASQADRPVRPLRHIGLAWASGIQRSLDGWRDYQSRSCRLTTLMAAIAASGLDPDHVQIHSLQMGPPLAELDTLAGYDDRLIQRWSSEIQSLADTGAIIDRLDLVISVDTSVAHLAAGLGKPTWLLLPWLPNWRWHLPALGPQFDRQTPWYPTMRLFRQTRPDDWPSLIDRLSAELRAWAQ